tara:strand:+ start:125 stop:367 length:243 start_codon:yes stop_codon:yes gene_type:complete
MKKIDYKDKNFRRDEFVRLTNIRMNHILKKIHLLGNLSSKQYYEYDQTDVRKIFNKINYDLRVAKKQFENSKKDKFDLEK